jgi:hypothetical protein
MSHVQAEHFWLPFQARPPLLPVYRYKKILPCPAKVAPDVELTSVKVDLIIRCVTKNKIPAKKKHIAFFHYLGFELGHCVWVAVHIEHIITDLQRLKRVKTSLLLNLKTKKSHHTTFISNLLVIAYQKTFMVYDLFKLSVNGLESEVKIERQLINSYI